MNCEKPISPVKLFVVVTHAKKINLLLADELKWLILTVGYKSRPNNFLYNCKGRYI